MRVVNIYDAKTQLSKLITQVLAGEEIVIAKSGKPLIKLSPYEAEIPPKRMGGQLRGILEMTEDFDAPLPDDILKTFYQDEN